MTSKVLLAIAALSVSVSPSPSASGPEAVPPLRRHMSKVSDAAFLSCACPGAVQFCTEWREKWAKDAAPEVRDQTVRECVADFMAAVTIRRP